MNNLDATSPGQIGMVFENVLANRTPVPICCIFLAGVCRRLRQRNGVVHGGGTSVARGRSRRPRLGGADGCDAGQDRARTEYGAPARLLDGESGGFRVALRA